MDYVYILDDVNNYLETLSSVEKGKVFADIEALGLGHYSLVHTKKLRGKIQELIVKQHRLLFFRVNRYIYFIDAFRKTTKKTPRNRIERAEKIYKQIIKR